MAGILAYALGGGEIMADVERAARGVNRLRTLLVNSYFVSESDGRTSPWVMVDAGLPGYARAIRRAAERLFERPPSAILLTHGHFDHVGGLPQLADWWDVPVYAHALELPYLTGKSAYPPADPTTGGGLFARAARFHPRRIDLSSRIRVLPADGSVPIVTEWQWLATPGHTSGHVSFFRESDRTLIAGDAVATTRQESLASVIRQRERVWRPPAYYTTDWDAARRSIERLAALEPNLLAAGHGHVLSGEPMRASLRDLVNNFDLVMPSRGRYVPYPAIADETGVVHLPPRVESRVGTRIALAAGAAAAAIAVIAIARRRPTEHAYSRRPSAI
jgi:glyoxylase-like metal-dependent hydrolase (beta-lactamase superfamily II)